MDIERAILILDDAAPYEGSEIGELWRNLVCVYDALENIESFNDARTAIGKAILFHARDIEENWRWVTKSDELIEAFDDIVDNGGTDKIEKFREVLRRLNPTDKRLEWIG